MRPILPGVLARGNSPVVAAPTFNLIPALLSQAEGNSGVTPFLITVQRTGDKSQTDTVTLSRLSGSALATDFQGNVFPSVTVTFPAGSSADQVVTINTNTNTTFEADKSFIMGLSNPSRGGLGSFTQCSCLIVNDDTAGVPLLSIAQPVPSALNEGNSGNTTGPTFVVTRYNITTGVTTVDWTIVGRGTYQVNAADFVAVSGTLTFNNGDTVKNIIPQFIGDTTPEQDEGYQVVLSNAVNGIITQATADGTILNDEGNVPVTLILPDAQLFVSFSDSGSAIGWADGSYNLGDGLTMAIASQARSITGVPF